MCGFFLFLCFSLSNFHSSVLYSFLFSPFSLFFFTCVILSFCVCFFLYFSLSDYSLLSLFNHSCFCYVSFLYQVPLFSILFLLVSPLSPFLPSGSYNLFSFLPFILYSGLQKLPLWQIFLGSISVYNVDSRYIVTTQFTVCLLIYLYFVFLF